MIATDKVDYDLLMVYIAADVKYSSIVVDVVVFCHVGRFLQ